MKYFIYVIISLFFILSNNLKAEVKNLTLDIMGIDITQGGKIYLFVCDEESFFNEDSHNTCQTVLAFKPSLERMKITIPIEEGVYGIYGYHFKSGDMIKETVPVMYSEIYKLLGTIGKRSISSKPSFSSFSYNILRNQTIIIRSHYSNW